MDTPNKASNYMEKCDCPECKPASDSWNYKEHCTCPRCERMRTEIQNSTHATAKVASGRSEEVAPPAEKFTYGGFDDTPNETFGVFPDVDPAGVEKQAKWYVPWSDARVREYARARQNLNNNYAASFATTPKPDEGSTAVEGAFVPSLNPDAGGAPEFLTNWTRYASPPAPSVEYSDPEQNPPEEDSAPLVNPPLASAECSTDNSLSTTLKYEESVDSVADEIFHLLMALDGVYRTPDSTASIPKSKENADLVVAVSSPASESAASDDPTSSPIIVEGVFGPWLSSDEGLASARKPKQYNGTLLKGFGAYNDTNRSGIASPSTTTGKPKTKNSGTMLMGYSGPARAAIEAPQNGCGTDAKVDSSTSGVADPTTLKTEKDPDTLSKPCEDCGSWFGSVISVPALTLKANIIELCKACGLCFDVVNGVAFTMPKPNDNCDSVVDVISEPLGSAVVGVASDSPPTDSTSATNSSTSDADESGPITMKTDTVDDVCGERGCWCEKPLGSAVVDSPLADSASATSVSMSISAESCPITLKTEEDPDAMDDVCGKVGCWCDKTLGSATVDVTSLPTAPPSEEDKMAEHLRLFDDYFLDLDCDATQTAPMKTGAESKC